MSLFRTLLLAAALGMSVTGHADGRPDTIRIPLAAIDEPVSYCIAAWMNGRKTLHRSADNPQRVERVTTSLSGLIPLEIGFNPDSTVTYRFGGLSDLTVPIDSMRQYRLRARRGAPTPRWNVGSMSRDGQDYAVWVKPNGNGSITLDSLLFLNDFMVQGLVGNVYRGTTVTGGDTLAVTVHRPMIDPNREGISFPHPAILPQGPYEDFSDYRPDIIDGIRAEEVRSTGDLLKLGPDNWYRIDGFSPDFAEMTLTAAESPRPEFLTDSAMALLRPWLDGAKAAGRPLLLDFWGTWCGPCVASLPRLKELEEKYDGRLEVLSVCFDTEENRDKADRMLDSRGLTGHRLFLAQDKPVPLLGELKISSFPTYLLLGDDGSILVRGSSAQCLDWVDRYLAD